MEKSTHTADYKRLLHELRQAREAGGLSQRDLATRLRVSHSWVAKVETGERRIDVVEMHWFLAACGADVLAVLPKVLAGGATTRKFFTAGRGPRK